MGKPGWGHAQSLITEYIGDVERTWGTETSQYLKEEKETSIPSVAASERGSAQTIPVRRDGVVGPTPRCGVYNGTHLESWTRQGNSPVHEIHKTAVGFLSTPGHEKPWRNPRGPSRKAKYSLVTDSEPVP